MSIPIMPDTASPTPDRGDSDIDRALRLYSAIADHGSDETLRYFTISGDPKSKARPRFGKGGRAYTSTESREAEARTAANLRARVTTPFTGNVALGCIFFRPNKQRIDADNMLKHICDAANGVLWHDDSQVTAIAGVVEYDPENPRTVIILGRHRSTMTRGSDAVRPCVVCGAEFSILTGNPSKKTCSKACSMRVRGAVPLSDPVPCGQCGELFVRTTSSQKLCSPSCRTASMVGKRKASARPASRCVDCGKALTHHRGGRCRSCWKSHVALASEVQQ